MKLKILLGLATLLLALNVGADDDDMFYVALSAPSEGETEVRAAVDLTKLARVFKEEVKNDKDWWDAFSSAVSRGVGNAGDKIQEHPWITLGSAVALYKVAEHNNLGGWFSGSGGAKEKEKNEKNGAIYLENVTINAPTAFNVSDNSHVHQSELQVEVAEPSE